MPQKAMDYILQQLINGITLGSIYGLIAIGYTMVYGIIGMINFAHGEIYMIGAFISFLAFGVLASMGITAIPLLLLLVLLIAMFMTAIYGWAVERIAYRPLRGQNRLAPLISAIGVSIFLQNYVQLSQGARVKAMPPVIEGKTMLFQGPVLDVTISNMQLMIIATTLLVLGIFWFIINKTSLGRCQRACEQDMKMAGLLGINVDRTIALTFIMGAALAAVAGMLVTMHYGVIDFYMGFFAGIKAFTAAVLGGIGSLGGAMLGGLIIGLVEALWSAMPYFLDDMGAFGEFIAPVFGQAYKNIAAFLVLILVLTIKPTGLFGKPEVEKV